VVPNYSADDLFVCCGVIPRASVGATLNLLYVDPWLCASRM
jgi:hypothetical protein